MAVGASSSHVIVNAFIITRNYIAPAITAIRNTTLAADKTENVLIKGMQFFQIRFRKLLDLSKKQICECS